MLKNLTHFSVFHFRLYLWDLWKNERQRKQSGLIWQMLMSGMECQNSTTDLISPLHNIFLCISVLEVIFIQLHWLNFVLFSKYILSYIRPSLFTYTHMCTHTQYKHTYSRVNAYTQKYSSSIKQSSTLLHWTGSVSVKSVTLFQSKHKRQDQNGFPTIYQYIQQLSSISIIQHIFLSSCRLQFVLVNYTVKKNYIGSLYL